MTSKTSDASLNDTAGVREGLFGPSALNRRHFANKLASVVVSFGGWTILLSIAAIVLVILFEAAPLFYPPETSLSRSGVLKSSHAPVVIESDPYLETMIAIYADGRVAGFFDDDSSVQETWSKSLRDSGRVVHSIALSKGRYVLQFEDHTLKLVEPRFDVHFENSTRVLVPRLLVDEDFPEALESLELPLGVAASSKRYVIVGLDEQGALVAHVTTLKRSLMGDVDSTTAHYKIGEVQQKVTAATIDSAGKKLFLGLNDGSINYYSIPRSSEPVLVSSIQSEQQPISSLKLLLGEQTLVSGSSAGRVTSYTLVRDDVEGEVLQQVHAFQSHSSAVREILASRRNKVFLTYDQDGQVRSHYATSGETQFSFRAFADGSDSIASVSLAPKGDGFVVGGRASKYELWSIDNPHPEISLRTLFLPTLYEGYAKKDFVWQSSGGTDEFEPKLSLVPLISGTLKATFYALLFAVPLGVFGAFYTSQFMHVRLKGILKPVVEVMAALPSVVVGFVAGLWLAPRLSAVLPGVFLLLPALLVAVTSAFILTRLLARRVSFFERAGIELLILVPTLILGVWGAFAVGAYFEATYCSGDFIAWLYQTFGIEVDQRNSIVAGIAVGFAVIPIIFTLSEDCLSAVPRSIVAGSLALGATRWQTSWKVVLPVAIPGIFSAVMIGVGRAIGETMIVLMATGNTPIMDWSVFNGFRAMSANIAVELPEAPHGATLYRVLFLTAFILFVMTFLLNTLSEFVKMHFRKRFKYL